MYKIINETIGEVLGYTQKPTYIRLSTAGNYTTADEENAQGLAYRSRPYNLRGREGVGVMETVFLIEIDEGLMLSDLTETGILIAEANIQNGSYFNIGKRVFLAMQSIVTGDLVVPNVNCREISLSEALNALNQEV